MVIIVSPDEWIMVLRLHEVENATCNMAHLTQRGSTAMATHHAALFIANGSWSWSALQAGVVHNASHVH